MELDRRLSPIQANEMNMGVNTEDTDMDMNIQNYSVEDLLKILRITSTDKITELVVYDKIAHFIKKFQIDGNYSLVKFFRDIQSRMREYFIPESDSKAESKSKLIKSNDEMNIPTVTTEGFQQMSLENRGGNANINSSSKSKNESEIQPLPPPSNPKKMTELTSTQPASQQLYATTTSPPTQTYSVPVSKGNLNPTLKNIISRIVNVDSQYRTIQTTDADTGSCNYTVHLSEMLKGVLNMRLFSIQVPYNWYSIDSSYGNNYFWIGVQDSGSSSFKKVKIIVPSGNYSPSQFVTRLNDVISSAGFSQSQTQPQNVIVSHDTSNNHITISLDGVIYTDPDTGVSITIVGVSDTTITTASTLIFYDENDIHVCTSDGSNGDISISSTLGWIMGFRSDVIDILVSGNVAPAVLSLHGTKYFTMILDDLKHNHVNDGIVTVAPTDMNMALPAYYNTGIPSNCSVDEYTALQTNPRTLTQSQLYTISEIMKHRTKTSNRTMVAPTNSDTFGLIPIKYGGMATGSLFTETTSTLQSNKRSYFGPVDIDRIKVKLLNDKGDVVDLHGTDWTFSMIVESLYQY